MRNISASRGIYRTTVERRMDAFGRHWTFNLEPEFDPRNLWIGVFWRFADAIHSRHFELSVCSRT